jgi:hypothetical protein
MNRISRLFTIFLAVIASLAMAPAATATNQTLPCLLSQVSVNTRPEPTQVPGGPLYLVVVTSMVSYQTDCRSTSYETTTGALAVHPLYVMERRSIDTGTYEAIRSFAPKIPFDGSGKLRRTAVVETSLPRGSYRVRSFDGTLPLENLPFAVGSTAADFPGVLPFAKALPADDRASLAYGQASAIVRKGVTYYRGFNPDGKIATGYLFQDQADGTTAILPVIFEQLDPNDGDNFANSMGFSGDLTWTRIKIATDQQIGSSLFDAGLPITGCVKTSVGTSCFNVFDPIAPFRDFDGNAAPFGAYAIGR